MGMDFKSFGLNEELIESLSELNIKIPTPIQEKSIKHILNGHDIIGISKTGTGKTYAFSLPIINYVINKNKSFKSLILTPTRELAQQINNTIKKIGRNFGLRTALLIGGDNLKSQSYVLRSHPHIIIGTPGRVVDHILNTKNFNLKKIKYLVIDEADKLLELDFSSDIQKILETVNKKRQTLLYSATITDKLKELIKKWLKYPIEINISTAYETVDSLIQKYIFVPIEKKHFYVVKLCTKINSRILIFTSSCFMTIALSEMLISLGFKAVGLHGKLSQNRRDKRLEKFKNNEIRILVATDIAARGLDILNIATVINYDVPESPKIYVQRVGRTARAGKSGMAITIISQYEIEIFQRIEYFLNKKIDEFEIDVHVNETEIEECYKKGYSKAKEEQKERKIKERKIKKLKMS